MSGSEFKQVDDVTPEITGILDSYMRWYNQAILGSTMLNDVSHYFESVLKQLSKTAFVTQRRFNRLIELQSNVLELRPNENKAAFAKKFETFFSELRALERDCILEDSGLDYVTGLKSKKFLTRDIERQMHRLSREGQSFCVALVAIDHYSESMESYGVSGEFKYSKTVAKLLKKSIRSFDVGYRTDGGEFVLLLKQTDIGGGIAALKRLREFLEQENLTLSTSDGDQPLRLSSCVTEPVPQENADELIENLRKDLERQKNNETGEEESDDQSGAVLKYHEVSALERYVNEKYSS
jgi:diguanylate cyclase